MPRSGRPARWIKLSRREWRVVFAALREYAQAQGARGRLLQSDGSSGRAFEEAAREARAAALKIGCDGEIAAYLGVRSAGRQGKYARLHERDPRDDYLDRDQAAGLIERNYTPAPGSWVADADSEAVAGRFLAWCEDTLTRPDAYGLDVFLTRHTGWTPENAPRGEEHGDDRDITGGDGGAAHAAVR